MILFIISHLLASLFEMGLELNSLDWNGNGLEHELELEDMKRTYILISGQLFEQSFDWLLSYSFSQFEDWFWNISIFLNYWVKNFVATEVTIHSPCEYAPDFPLYNSTMQRNQMSLVKDFGN